MIFQRSVLKSFDPSDDIPNCDVFQFIPENADGFLVMEVQVHYNAGPNSPSVVSCLSLWVQLNLRD